MPVFGRTSELDQIGQALRRPYLVGVVLSGPTGVGKSTLLGVAASRAEEQGFSVIRLEPNAAVSTIPLFVFSTVVDGFSDAATTQRFVTVREALKERRRHGPLLLVIDDLHALDDASAALVGQLAREGTVFVLGSARTSEPMPDPVAALWVQALALMIDVGPLPREAAAEVAAQLLGGTLDPKLESAIWRRTCGNPLHVRELVTGSRRAGAVGHVGTVWSRTGELVASDALVDLVAHRIGELDGPQRAALCAVSLAEPASVALVAAVSAEVLASLEEAGVVRVVLDRRRLTVRLAHPIYGDAVRAASSQLRARELRSSLAEAVAGWGARRSDDLLQVASWRIDAGEFDAAQFAGAAFEAVHRNDLDLATRLAEAAHEAGASGLATRAVAMTQHLLGRHQWPSSTVRSATRSSPPPRQTVCASSRAWSWRAAQATTSAPSPRWSP